MLNNKKGNKNNNRQPIVFVHREIIKKLAVVICHTK